MLGLLGLLALLGARLTSASRTEAQIAFAPRASAAAEVAADSAVNDVAMRLLRGTWPASGLAWRVAPEPIRVGAVPVDVLVTDEAVKINPNHASSRLLRSLMIQAGVDEFTATSLADAIIEWRRPSPFSSGGDRKRTRYEASGLAYAPSDRPFDNVDEIELVLGMTPRIFALIRPALTVYDVGDVKLEGASPLVAEAVRSARDVEHGAGTIGFPSPDQVVRIRATATVRGARFTRESVVRLKGRPRADEAPYQFLTWDVGTGNDAANERGQAATEVGRRPPPAR